jgi:hypothetical protein
VVFVVDHSGSMLDTFDFLRQELKERMGKLSPAQAFAIVMFSETVDAAYPGKEKAPPETLAHGTPAEKKAAELFLDGVRAAGQNDGLINPFDQAMTAAFKLKPEVIFLLSDGEADPKLADVVAKLNKAAGGKVRVHTIAYLKVSDKGETTLKTIAKENGGTFKYVKEADLVAPKTAPEK